MLSAASATSDPPASPPPRPSRGPRFLQPLRMPLRARSWREAVYCLIGAPVGVAGAVLVLVLLALGLGFALSMVGAVLGLVLLALATVLARGLGAVHRELAGRLIGERTAPAPAFRAPPGLGLLGRVDARLRDGNAWRQVAYVLAKLPLALCGLYGVAWWVVGLANVASPVRWFVPGQRGSDGGLGLPTPLPFGGFPVVHSFGGALLGVVFGAVLLLIAPWLTRAVARVDIRLVRALLGPGAMAERVRDLEETRALAVDDSAALLRRLERDLHDGAQVRLVALALSLDMIKDKLAAGQAPDLGPVRRLVDGARENATAALTELRDLSRGLHPPVLDDGLPDALASLTSRSSVPVELTVEVSERPSPAIETIAYFCAAELLANVIKHSGAARATVSAVRRPDGTLRLRVGDDGHGGARSHPAGGLAGLRQRVRTVDGTLDLSSPEGGPTVVTVDLPPHA
ncbi:Sensor histidine kinase LiaS [Streptomyces sp. YIM 130001]|uniref:sensor histidine kinase n=1 Tax=Streptomyces sp. YIM 130001 TaxID=2259644 RepID=UPI000EEAC2F9|nr:sensor histidine kinase [Streptomyces sp. YIM 130001]RII14691.1 Sensor histidine kinase LiaS [Streptomyces sp. YIM 130001]